MPSCVIFVPAYNAARTIGPVIERIPAELWPAVVAAIVIDDGSSDGTADAVAGLQTRFAKVRLTAHPHNRGFRAAG